MLWRFVDWQRLAVGSCAGFVLALLVARGAEAQELPRYAVKWSTAENARGCLQQAELAAAVGQLVSAERLATTDQADRVIFGRAEHDEAWHTTLKVVDVTGTVLGEREIKSDGDSCSELSASVALAIALIIDPEHIPHAVTTGTVLGVPVTPAPPTPPAALPEAPVPAEATPSAREPPPLLQFIPKPRRAVKGGTVLLSGVLPEFQVGAQLEYWQPLVSLNSLRLALAYFGSQTKDVPGRAGASAKLYLVTARAAYCPLLVADRKVAVFGCAGLESGLMVGRGQGGGYESTSVRGLLTLDGALTVDWSVPGGAWAASLTGGAGVALIRPQFTYQTAAAAIEVHRAGPLEGRVEIGLGYRF